MRVARWIETVRLKLETSHLKLNPAIFRLYDLNTGIIGVGGDRHEWPHKPLLLLAVLDLLDEGKATIF